MAKEAANPDNFYLKLCKAYEGNWRQNGLLLKYGEHRQVVSEGPEGLTLKAYEGDHYTCN